MSTNCLVATSNVKQYTGITSSSYDGLIESYVPMILDDIVNYTQNSFAHSTAYYADDDISFTTSSITTLDTAVELNRFWMSGSVIRILGSYFNDGFYSCSTVASSYILLNETINTESSSTGKLIKLFKVEYPKDIPLIASRMIKHLILTLDNPNVNSESLGDHSISYATVGSNSYPESIVKSLDKYRKIRCQ